MRSFETEIIVMAAVLWILGHIIPAVHLLGVRESVKLTDNFLSPQQSRNHSTDYWNTKFKPEGHSKGNRQAQNLLSNVSYYLNYDLARQDKVSLSGMTMRTKKVSSRSKQDDLIPGINYFEMETKVILDTVLLDAIKASSIPLLEYVHVFFDSVNHMYEMSHSDDDEFPTFKIKVVDIKELNEKKESDIFPLVPDEDFSDIEKVLLHLRKKAKSWKFDKFDHIILLTGRDMYRKVNEQYDPDVLGVAFLNGTCSKTDEKYRSISVVEDIGAHFLGVYPAVHEIAHNLGAKHDSKTTSTYNCHAKRGYIMSPVTERTRNMFTFSECSLSSLKTFFFSQQGKCLAKGNLKPAFPDNLPVRYPGDLYTMEDICEHLAGMNFENEVYYESYVNPAKSPSFLCKQISCKVKLSGDRKILLEPPFAPGENMACGEGGKCKSGECVY